VSFFVSRGKLQEEAEKRVKGKKKKRKRTRGGQSLPKNVGKLVSRAFFNLDLVPRLEREINRRVGSRDEKRHAVVFCQHCQLIIEGRKERKKKKLKMNATCRENSKEGKKKT
jgi:hypothetical protein